MHADPADLGQHVIDACLAMGFACAGIALAKPTERRAEFLAWLDAGKHGDMAFMAEYVEERLDVTRLLPGAKAVIVVADQYATRQAADHAIEQFCSTDQEKHPVPHARIARYAHGRDYHAVIRKRTHDLSDRLRHLYPAAKFRAFVDTGPALEREHAGNAGLGFIGKHTLLINPRLGSWLLLGGIATTLDIVQPREHAAISKTNHCGTCTLCIDACPTGAITPFSVDATRCISYLTLEHRGVIDARFHAAMGDRLIGCDVCQDVCPFNHDHGDGTPGDRVNPAYADTDGVRARLPILDVLGWTEADRTRMLSGSAAKRASLEMIKRNALIVAGNACDDRQNPALAAAILRVRDDEGECEMVRETARIVAESVRETGER